MNTARQAFLDKSIRYVFFMLGLGFMVLGTSQPAHATLSDISQNIIESITDLPSLLSGLSYMLGLLFGALGVMKLKGHVENPNSIGMAQIMAHFIGGGALFALPIGYEAMFNSINTGGNVDVGATIATAVSGVFGAIARIVPIQDFNQILANIIDSVTDVPSLVSGVAYGMGLLIGVAGILKLKEHIEDPRSAKIKDVVGRFLTAGALLALPTMYVAMFNTVNGEGGGLFGALAQVYIAAVSGGVSSEIQGIGCIAVPGAGAVIGALGGGGLDVVICNLFRGTISLPAFLTAIAYMFGLFVGVWGIFKLQDHVLDPQQTKVWDPVSKLLVAGGFFALPSIISVAYNTVANLLIPHINEGFNDAGAVGGGLDTMLTFLMRDVFGPMTVLINWFGVVAGFILVFIGISRLLKSSQEGPKGPGGIGTLMTFVVGGALLSFSPMISALSTTVFNDPLTATFGVLNYTAGMTGQEVAHAEAVIAAVIKFLIVLGLISVMRGIFIMRDVAEGSSQASMMAGITHIVGGAIAVNIGPMLEAVQATLGITAQGLGIGF